MPKIKAYQQIDSSDCGITCIRIIVRYYGRVVPSRFLRDICNLGRIGMSLRDVLLCMRKLGFCTEVVRIGEDDVRRMPLPAIMYWEQRHYVVLYKMSRDGHYFHIADPANGKVRLSRESFLRHWLMQGNKGLAIVADPTDDFHNIEYPIDESVDGGLCNLVSRVFRDNRKQFAAIAILMIVAIVADIVSPMLFQRMVDEGIGGLDVSLVWLLVVGQFFVFIGSYVSSCITDLIITKTGLDMGIKMLNEYLSKLVKLPLSFFDCRVNSDLIQKVEDQNRLKNFLLEMPQSTFLAAASIIVFSCLVIYYNPLVFGIFIGCMILSFMWTHLFMRRRKAIDYSYFSYVSDNRNNIYELINGMQDVKVNNAQRARIDVWNDVQQKVNRLSMKSTYLNMVINSGNSFIARARDIIITGFCATMVVKADMTIGEMMTITYLAGRLDAPLNSIISMIGHAQDASISYSRIEDVMNCDEDEGQDVTTINISQSPTLRLEDVSFRYSGATSPFIINDFCAVLPQCKTTAIVGASGCGKSTLIKLLLGFYTPQKGKVFMNDVDMSCLSKDKWLANCGVVMQNGFVFSGTVLDNIALADKQPDLERAMEAARIACIDDFFKALPMGYHTRLGNAGMELSGGQRQRLLIARAIYRNPSFLVLDEATSSLDANNESQIVRNLATFNNGRTVVIAAHRLSTVRHADNIIYMDKGRVVEQGTHESLVSMRGAYYRLVKEQLLLDAVSSATT